jgi:hypothetical protein
VSFKTPNVSAWRTSLLRSGLANLRCEFLPPVPTTNSRMPRLSGTGVTTMQTVVTSLADLATPGRAMKIASIMSDAETDECFLVFVGDTEPRRELSEPEEAQSSFRGAMSQMDSEGQHSCSFDVPTTRSPAAEIRYVRLYCGAKRIEIMLTNVFNGEGKGQHVSINEVLSSEASR